MNTIQIIRHLEDIDDLKTFWRDWPLLPWQEDKALEIAKNLNILLESENKKGLLLITSPRKRTQETARLVRAELRKINPNIKTIINNEEKIREIDQWSFILPDNYRAGDVFEWLQLAGTIFFNEVFWSDNMLENNYTYKYWDYIENNKWIKYPELKKYFIKFWESYRDVLVRVYSQVLDGAKKLSRLPNNFWIALVTHWQPYQILKDLVDVANEIKKWNINLKLWELPYFCREAYKKRKEKKRNLWQTDILPLEDLKNPKLLELLEKEIKFLQELS